MATECTCLDCCYARKHPQLGPAPHAGGVVVAINGDAAGHRTEIVLLPSGERIQRPADEVRPPERTYPLDRPAEDPRFTFGLVIDIAARLEQAGYPKLQPLDIVRLQQALFRFVYVDEEGSV